MRDDTAGAQQLHFVIGVDEKEKLSGIISEVKCESRKGCNLRTDEKQLTSLLLAHIINPARLAVEFKVKTRSNGLSFICHKALREIFNK